MFKAKYIIIGDSNPVVFPETMIHKDVAWALAGGKKCIGAGFVILTEEGYACYGESISLQVKSRGAADSQILNRFLGGPSKDL